MSKSVPEYDPDTVGTIAEKGLARRSGQAFLRKALLYCSTLFSLVALAAIIYFLRLDTFTGREKALVDLLMVGVAVGFLVSLYMAVDSSLKGPADGGRSTHTGRR